MISTKNFIFVLAFLVLQLRPACSDQMWHCLDGESIDISYLCDGLHDCNDRSDEASCGERSCTDMQFQCGDKRKCIANGLRCNLHTDCDDGSDEIDCEEDTRQCRKDQFYCDDQCIPEEWVCDDENDCPNAQDEANCTSQNSLVCRNDEVKCNFTNICISKSWLCDGDGDCTDGKNASDDEDERNCKGILTHNHEILSKTACTLRRNLTVWNSGDYENVMVCDQKCTGNVNVPCECLSGYQINPENVFHCKLTSDPVPYLYFAVDKRIIRRSLGNQPTEEFFVDITSRDSNQSQPHSSRVTSIDYDHHSHTLLWVDYNSGSILSFNERIKKTQVLAQVPGTFGLALDWVTPVIYFAVRPKDSSSFGYVAVLPLKRTSIVISTSTAVRIATFVDPVSVAVYPRRGTMLVVDQGRDDAASRIVMTDMDGRNSRDFVVEHQRKVTSVVIDYVTDVVYWSESSALMGSRIEMKTIDGSQRKTLVARSMGFMPIASPFSISCFEDRVVFSDDVTREVWEIDSMLGKPRGYPYNHKPFVKATGNISAIHVSHPSLQPVDAEAKFCLASECSHVCVLKPMGYRCLCPSPLILADDEKTCVDITTKIVTVPKTPAPRVAPSSETTPSVATTEVVKTLSETPKKTVLCSRKASSRSFGTMYYTVGYLLTVKCEPGMHVRGFPGKTSIDNVCLSSGEWSVTIKVCVPYQCSELHCGDFGVCGKTSSYNAVCKCRDGTLKFSSCPVVTTTSTPTTTTIQQATTTTKQPLTTTTTKQPLTTTTTKQPPTTTTTPITTATQLPSTTAILRTTTPLSSSKTSAAQINSAMDGNNTGKIVAVVMCMALLGLIGGCLVFFCWNRKRNISVTSRYAKKPTPLKKYRAERLVKQGIVKRDTVQEVEEIGRDHCITNPNYSSPKTRIRLKLPDDMDSGVDRSSVSLSSQDSPAQGYTYKSLANATPTSPASSVEDLNEMEIANDNSLSRPRIRSAISSVFNLRRSESLEAMIPPEE